MREAKLSRLYSLHMFLRRTQRLEVPALPRVDALSDTELVKLHDLIWQKVEELHPTGDDLVDHLSSLSLIDARNRPYDEFYPEYVDSVEYALEELLSVNHADAKEAAMLVMLFMNQVYEAELCVNTATLRRQ
jgi:hypothetical protein